MLENAPVLVALKEVGVDPESLVEYADFMFQSDSHGQSFDAKLDLDDFMEIVLKLRSANSAQAVVKDVVDLKRFIQAESTSTNNLLIELTAQQAILEDGQK